SAFVVVPTLFAFLLGVFYQEYAWAVAGVRVLEKTDPAVMLIGASGMILAFRYRIAYRPLARLGNYAYTVYLLHVFGTSPGRVLANRVLQGRLPLLTFAVSLLFGLASPILVESALRRNSWLSLLLLGQTAPGRRGPVTATVPSHRATSGEIAAGTSSKDESHA
ncbi:MAG: hypothetical protein KA745_14595, partial [Gemmatimonadales bacterium]|nr:hypothetical protein [Gemmatimonadales bacterium]